MVLERIEQRFRFTAPPTSPKEVKRFHIERRMFCIKDGSVLLAPKGFNGSHAKWFLEEGWISEEDDRFMQEKVRGMTYRGNLYFYSGWDFRVDLQAEQEFFDCAGDLTNRLAQEDIHIQNVYGGLVDVRGRVNFKPVKYYPNKTNSDGSMMVENNT